MSKPLDLIIAVMEGKKMLLIVIMAITVMEVRVANAIVFIATGKIALKGNMTFIQCIVLGCISCHIFLLPTFLHNEGQDQPDLFCVYSACKQFIQNSLFDFVFRT